MEKEEKRRGKRGREKSREDEKGRKEEGRKGRKPRRGERKGKCSWERERKR